MMKLNSSVFYTMQLDSSQNKFIYSHNWEKNDLIIWDNRSILHRGQSYNSAEPRYLIRTTVMDNTARATYLK